MKTLINTKNAHINVLLRSNENTILSLVIPDAPIGCPRDIAPPFMLTFSGLSPSSLITAKDWAANASLISKRSISSRFQPAFDT